MNWIDPVTAAFALTRAVHFGATLLLLGVLVFDRLVVGPAAAGVDLWKQRWNRIAASLLLVALPLTLISGVAWLIFVTMGMNEISFGEALRVDALKTVLDQSQFGHLWKIRFFIWTASVLATAMVVSLRRGSVLNRFFRWTSLLCMVALTASLARSGHGADGSRVHQTADAAHLVIAGAWPLGLIPLALLLVSVRRSVGLEKWIAMLPIIQRFSLMSLGSVLFIAVSGVINSWSLLGSVASLYQTLYGRTLLVKVALFGVMILLGAFNMLYLRPRLAIDFPHSTEAGRETALRRLQRNVWIEVLLGAAVLIAVGLLGTVSPGCGECCSSTAASVCK